MGKQKVPDEKIIPLILAGRTNSEILKYFGLKPGYLQGPIKRLREKLGIPSPGRRPQKPKPLPTAKKIPFADGVTTYYMSPEEIQERYGPPRLLAKGSRPGDAEADNYLKSKAADLKETARKAERRPK